MDEVAASLVRRWKFVFLVTFVAGLVSVAVVLLTPKVYRAQMDLIVTALDLGEKVQTEVGTALDELVPEPLSPKVYVDMIRSTSVIGTVLEDLIAQGAFGQEEAPPLEEFLLDLGVRNPQVDQTTRPINLSPIITLSANSNSPDLVKAIVETWAKVSIKVAERATYYSFAAVADILTTQEQEHKQTLEIIWSKIATERETWNIDVIAAKMDNRLKRMLGLNTQRKETELEISAARERLEVIQSGLAQESRFIKLYRAPSDTAYFIVDELSSSGSTSDSNISDKGLVSEEMNPIYWDLKSQENEATLAVRTGETKLAVLNRQWESATQEQQDLEKVLAEHSRIQQDLTTSESIANTIYRQIASTGAVVHAVKGLTTASGEDRIASVGLNRLTEKIYPVEFKGIIGNKVGVGATTLLAALLACTYVLTVDFGGIFLKRLAMLAPKG